MVDTVFLEGTGCECDVTLDTWLKDALPHLPGVVRSAAARELVLTARDFFERTLAWTTWITDVNMKSGAKQYWLSPYDTYSNVIGVLAVVFKPDGPTSGRPLSPLTCRPAAVFTSNTPLNFYADSPPDAVFLYPEPDRDLDSSLDFYVALTPKQSVEHLPRIATIKFHDAILQGFLGRMMMQPGKPYSNPPLASTYLREYSSMIGRYRGQAKTGFVQAQSWSYPSGWGVRKTGRHRE
jgi:hypothetical protein